LVARPAVILFDEPLSSLDTPLRADLKAQLLKLHREVQFTGIYVTHDRTEALSVGDRVAILRSGRLEQIGTPEQVFTSPRSKYVAEFLGASNSVEVTAVDSGWMVVGAGMIEGKLPAALRIDAGVKRREFVFGPTALLLEPVGASREPATSETLCLGVGTIAEALYAGTEMHYVVEFGRTTLNVVSASHAEKYRRGEEVRVRAITASIHVFGV
jgi:iron(III) transport system ATP-binding protein